jgi:hypothetical protein
MGGLTADNSNNIGDKFLSRTGDLGPISDDLFFPQVSFGNNKVIPKVKVQDKDGESSHDMMNLLEVFHEMYWVNPMERPKIFLKGEN